MPTKANVSSTTLIPVLLGRALVYFVLSAFMLEFLCGCKVSLHVSCMRHSLSQGMMGN